MEDLVLLDGLMRTPNAMTDELGALPVPVQCNAEVDRSFNLSGLKLGLPSNFGWVHPGLSGEVTVPTSSCINKACELLFDLGMSSIMRPAKTLIVVGNFTGSAPL